MSYIECFGAIPSPKDVRDYKGVCAVDSSSFPEEFELLMTSVKNQGSVGSCVAHSIATTIEHFNSVQGDSKEKISTGFIYGNRSETDYAGVGLVVAQALNRVIKCGSVKNTQFNHNVEVPKAQELVQAKIMELLPDAFPNRFTSYFRLNDDDAIKASLLQNGPVIFAMKWFKDLKVVDGIMTTNFEDSDSYHCMVIYGWNKDGWKIQNSWGTTWGKKGRAILPYDIPRTETWGVTDTYSETLRQQEIESYVDIINDLEIKLISTENQLVLLQSRLDDFLEADEYAELSSKYDELQQLYSDSVDKIISYENQIEALQKQLIDIEKPYSSQLGQFIAKLINFIIKLTTK